MPRVAIIGSGLIGRAWAMVFARAGWDVAMYDAVEGVADKALGLVAEGLERACEARPRQGPEGCGGARARGEKRRRCARWRELRAGEHAGDGRGQARDLRRARCASRPDAILASSTSAIVASLFTENLPGRARCLVAHPVNPPHLVPIVELVGAPWTAPETIARAKAIYESVRQVPIVVRREIEGFILNRLQAVLLAEAFRLVGEGYVSPQDLDKTLKDGLGLRWSFMGPFETIELNAPGGIADYCAAIRECTGACREASGAGGVRGDECRGIMREWGKGDAEQRLNSAARTRRWRRTRTVIARTQAAHEAHQRLTSRSCARRVARRIDFARPPRQIEPRHLPCALGDHLAAPHDKQPARLQPDRLDRIGGLQHHEVGVASDLEAVAFEPHDPARRSSSRRRSSGASPRCAGHLRRHAGPCARPRACRRSPAVPRVHHAVVAERDVDAVRAISSGTRVMPRRFG